MRKTFFFCAAILFFSGSTIAQKMYRCGSTFSQTPCGKDAKEIQIQGISPTNGSTTRILPDNATDEMKQRSIDLCKSAVVARLKDPDSAQFQSISRGNPLERQLPVLTGPLVKTSGYTGYVNAKNSYGGYTGNKLFACWLDYATESTVLDVSFLN